MKELIAIIAITSAALSGSFAMAAEPTKPTIVLVHGDNYDQNFDYKCNASANVTSTVMEPSCPTNALSKAVRIVDDRRTRRHMPR
jgi:hypothetical protein